MDIMPTSLTLLQNKQTLLVDKGVLNVPLLHALINFLFQVDFSMHILEIQKMESSKPLLVCFTCTCYY